MDPMPQTDEQSGGTDNDKTVAELIRDILETIARIDGKLAVSR